MHPEMSTSGGGGLVLWATKVSDTSSPITMNPKQKDHSTTKDQEEVESSSSEEGDKNPKKEATSRDTGNGVTAINKHILN